MVHRCKDLLKKRKTCVTDYTQEKIILISMSSVLRPSQHFSGLHKSTP